MVLLGLMSSPTFENCEYFGEVKRMENSIDKVDLYKKCTDEYYNLYVAFIRSGFGMEQAFELVKAHCNSVNIQNMFEAIDRQYRRSKRSDIYTDSEENTEDSES